NADGTNYFAPVDPVRPIDPSQHTDHPSLTAPIIADLMGLGSPQIIMGGGGAFEMVILDSSGNQLTRKTCCPNNPTFSLLLQYQASTKPAVADIDGDGKLELIEGSALSNSGNPTNAAVYVWTFANSDASKRPPWPSYRHDSRNTATYDNLFADGFD